MRTILILCLLGGVFADYDWRPRQEFRFQLEGRSLAGVSSLTQQFSGVHYRGVLKVQTQSADVLAMKLHNMTYTKVHAQLEGGWWDEIPGSEANFGKLPISESTFIAKLSKGKVESLVVSRKLPDWQVNFLQGVSSQLQFDLSGSNAIRRINSNSIGGRGNPPAVFTVMEDSVTGRCEVLYETSPLPRSRMDYAVDLCGSRPLIEITKTRNHSNCQVNPEYHFGLPSNLRCQPNGNQCGKFWTRSTVTRAIGCGTRGDLLILTSTTSNRIFVNLHLHNGTRAEANSYTNLTLISVHSISKGFTPPSDPMNIPHLHYKYTQETSKSRECSVSSKPPKGQHPEKDRPHNFDSTPSESSEAEDAKFRFKRKSRSKSKSKSKKNKPAEASTASSEENSEVDVSEMDWDDKGLWEGSSKDNSLPPALPFDALSLAQGKFGQRPCLSQQLTDLFADIANDLDSRDLSVEKGTLRKVVLATKLCRTMNQAELKKAIGSLMDAQIRKNWVLMPERKVIRDIITMCGTNPAFEIIASWIEEQKIKGDEAASVISYVAAYLISPSKRTIDRFYELIRDSASKYDQNLRTSAILAFSNLLRVACVSRAERRMRFPYNVYGNPCHEASVSHYIPYLKSQLRADPTTRPAVLTALGNTASLLALPPLMEAARDASYTPYQRARAVTAMKHIVLSEPRTASTALLSLYSDKQMPELVRLTAVSMLFFARPTMPVWHRIAVGTWFEQSSSIRTFIWSSLKTFADSGEEGVSEMSAAAAAVLPLARPSGYPKRQLVDNLMLTRTVSDLQEVIKNQMILFGGITGSNIYTRHTNRIAGFSRVTVESDFWLANTNAFMRSMMEFFSGNDDRAHVRPPIPGLSRATHMLRETLKIAPRTGPKMEGDIHWRLHKLVESMTILTKGKIAEWSKAAKRLPEELRNGMNFHKMSLGSSEFVMSTTTEMGFPVSFKVSNPWMLRTSGRANLSKEGAQEIMADMSFMYGEGLDAELSVYTPFDGVEHVATHQSRRLFTPPATRFSASRNQTGDAVVVSMWPLSAFDKPSTVYKELNRPFTVQRDASKLDAIDVEKNTKEIHFEDGTGGEMSPMEPFIFKYNRELASSPRGVQMDFNPFRPLLVLGYSFIWPSLTASTIELQMENFPGVTLEVGIGRALAGPSGVQMLKTWPSSKQPVGKASGESTEASGGSGGDSSTTEGPLSSAVPTAPTSTTPLTESPAGEEVTTEAGGEAAGSGEEAGENGRRSNSEDPFRVYDINVEVPVGEFNASSMDVFGAEDSGSRINYVLGKSLTGIESGRAYALGVVASTGGSSPKSTAAAYFCLSQETGGRLTRAAIFLKNNNGSTIGMTGALHWPATPIVSLAEMLRSDLSSHVYADIIKSESEPLSIQGTMVRSVRKAAVLQGRKDAEECAREGLNLEPKCRGIFEEAGALDRYNFTLRSNEGFTSLANSYFLNELKYWYYPYFSEVRANDANSVGQASITIDVCRTNDCINGGVRLPNGRVNFDRVPTNPRLTSNLMLSPVSGSFAFLQSSSFCSLEQKRLVTFDGVKFEPHLSDCWHLLAKDCSGVSRVAVLAQRRHNGTELELNLDNYRVLRLLPGPRAEVNGRPVEIGVNKMAEVSDLAGTTLMVITKGVDQAIGVKIPTHGFDILYADSGALITADNSLRGRLCGLCGDYDGQQVGEMKKADAGIATSVKEFVSSYEIKSGGQCNKN
ncbi:vitellogenin-like [Hetaerina americana]|uniref:vitellogenin-like n=1 Tax=Hetaerina americana TaxID=62018 RepID=UPI003A7F3D9E